MDFEQAWKRQQKKKEDEIPSCALHHTQIIIFPPTSPVLLEHANWNPSFWVEWLNSDSLRFPSSTTTHKKKTKTKTKLILQKKIMFMKLHGAQKNSQMNDVCCWIVTKEKIEKEMWLCMIYTRWVFCASGTVRAPLRYHYVIECNFHLCLAFMFLSVSFNL